jgi:NCS1 family nucleobase:cation symporter-1
VRASFGVRGANLPAVLRALVACGWFGIQTWIGGWCIYKVLETYNPAWADLPTIGSLGINQPQLICFLAFWAVNVVIIFLGIDSIRFLLNIKAPILIVLGLALLAWAVTTAGGFGPILSKPARLVGPDFWAFFFPALTGAVGYWATLSLNIPDFTRYAKSQKDQLWGQILGLPTTMGLYSFIGVAVTSATVVIYGAAISDPVQLLSRFHSPVTVIISLVAILLATLNVNIGANVVSPANDFSNLWPRRISFKVGGVITCFMGIAMMPWKLLANYDSFVVAWLGGYAAVLGSLAGIMICDYFIVRRKRLAVDDLYLRGGEYEYANGFNWRAIGALVIGSAVALMGLVIPAVRFLYDYSWFVGFMVAFAAYYTLMSSRRPRFTAA